MPVIDVAAQRKAFTGELAKSRKVGDFNHLRGSARRVDDGCRRQADDDASAADGSAGGGRAASEGRPTSSTLRGASACEADDERLTHWLEDAKEGRGQSGLALVLKLRQFRRRHNVQANPASFRASSGRRAA